VLTSISGVSTTDKRCSVDHGATPSACTAYQSV